MLSFPSSLNVGGNSMVQSGKWKSHEVPGMATKFGGATERMKALNINLSSPVKSMLYTEGNINISTRDELTNDLMLVGKSSKSYVENVNHMPSNLINTMNRYRFIYSNALKSLVDVGKLNDSTLQMTLSQTATTASMFNPLFNIQVSGIMQNVPLLNDYTGDKYHSGHDDGSMSIDNCTIRELVTLSHKQNSILGSAKYRYADFMYCKDLGKVANNHLITLRKFAHPIGDNIFELTSPKYRNGGTYDFYPEMDVGRLVTWFGTDDNKLNDILKFNYNASWKPLNSKIQEVDTRSDSSDRGIIGFLGNTINPDYNNYAGGGWHGNSLWSKFGSTLNPGISQGIGDNNEILRNYDNNKVYTPKNTVQDTHTYEGKLTLQHEFTINFCYKLRAYENINPRSALLDLLGNILEVTYRRGKFWGGSRKWIGPPQNKAAFNKVNAFVDNAWDKLGGFMSAMASGTIDFGDIMASISSALSEGVASVFNNAKGYASKIMSGQSNIIQSMAQGLSMLNQKTHFSHALKGQLKAALGRPALYAIDSLLSGDDVGLWHVTIGNPKAPIAGIGNLILTNATVEFSGPLGIDDFPTDIKVSVTLKPGRSRDITEISRAFTGGKGSIYYPTAGHKLADFYNIAGGFDEDEIDKAQREANKAMERTEKANKYAYDIATKNAAGESKQQDASIDASTEQQPKSESVPKQSKAQLQAEEQERAAIDKVNQIRNAQYIQANKDIQKLGVDDVWVDSPEVNTESALFTESTNSKIGPELRISIDEIA